MRDLGVGGAGWLAGGRAGLGLWVWAGGEVGGGGGAWAVVLLGLGFFLGLLSGFLHLQKEGAGISQSVSIGLLLRAAGLRSTIFP